MQRSCSRPTVRVPAVVLVVNTEQCRCADCCMCRRRIKKLRQAADDMAADDIREFNEGVDLAVTEAIDNNKRGSE